MPSNEPGKFPLNECTHIFIHHHLALENVGDMVSGITILASTGMKNKLNLLYIIIHTGEKDNASSVCLLIARISLSVLNFLVPFISIDFDRRMAVSVVLNFQLLIKKPKANTTERIIARIVLCQVKDLSIVDNLLSRSMTVLLA